MLQQCRMPISVVPILNGVALVRHAHTLGCRETGDFDPRDSQIVAMLSGVCMREASLRFGLQHFPLFVPDSPQTMSFRVAVLRFNDERASFFLRASAIAIRLHGGIWPNVGPRMWQPGKHSSTWRGVGTFVAVCAWPSGVGTWPRQRHCCGSPCIG